MAQETLSFEQAFERLEHILEKMNSGKAPLEESLKLFEEAEKLMRICGTRLNTAEQKSNSSLRAEAKSHSMRNKNRKRSFSPAHPKQKSCRFKLIKKITTELHRG